LDEKLVLHFAVLRWFLGHGEEIFQQLLPCLLSFVQSNEFLERFFEKRVSDPSPSPGVGLFAFYSKAYIMEKINETTGRNPV
jgi:hypothetical protein